MVAAGFHSLTVAEVQRETEDAVCLRFEVPPALAATFAFTQGQYLTLRRDLDGEDVRRSYSICSGVDDGEVGCVRRLHRVGREGVVVGAHELAGAVRRVGRGAADPAGHPGARSADLGGLSRSAARPGLPRAHHPAPPAHPHGRVR